MIVFFHSLTPLSSLDIFNQLKKLRKHAAAPYSHYSVAAIAEVKRENSFFYTSGVNVEVEGHNRLSLHGEQNAVINAIALLGSNTKFSRVWIMAAPTNAVPNEKPTAGKSCGHCRQVMISLAEQGAEIFVVTLDGEFLPPDSFEKKFLPDSFSEQDLKLSPMNVTSGFHSSSNANLAETFSTSSKLAAWEISNESQHLKTDKIAQYLRVLSPHIIDENFKTSPITACIVKCNNGRYAAGVLVQDIAFLTTDAIFAAIGNAITQFGSKDLYFDEIHLASTELCPSQLTLTEIEVLCSYAHSRTNVHFYTSSGQCALWPFLKCKHEREKIIDQRLENNLEKIS